jgi:hypothetical protein
MRLIRTRQTDQFKEIEVEHSFLFFKYRQKYRQFNGVILAFIEPDKYYKISFNTYCDINCLFDIKLPTPY